MVIYFNKVLCIIAVTNYNVLNFPRKINIQDTNKPIV